MTTPPTPGQGSKPAAVPGTVSRTPAKRKARELAKHLRAERPDYAYLKEVVRYLRAELEIEVQRVPKKLPYVPTEDGRSLYVMAARRVDSAPEGKGLTWPDGALQLVETKEACGCHHDEPDCPHREPMEPAKA